jgi:hypothetical protein
MVSRVALDKFEYIKGVIEAVNWRADNPLAKRKRSKGQNITQKTDN